MRRLLLVAIAAGCASDRGVRESTAVREGIGRAWREHFDAVKRKDAAGAGRLYADDVLYIVQGECEVRGRKAIDEMEAQGIAGAEIGEVRHWTEALSIADGIVSEIGTVRGPVKPHGQAEKVVTFRYMARWTKEPAPELGWHRPEGRWRIRCIVGEMVP